MTSSIPEGVHANEGDIQQVRQDLLWLLAAPPLLSDPRLQWHPNGAFEPALIDDLPEAELKRLVRLRSRTLGAYFEGLANALFGASHRYAVLASNRVVQGPKRTLGEIDLLLLDRVDGQVLHLELALKFYLRLTAPAGLENDDRLWIGSGQRDFLAVKHDRLLAHQLDLPALAQRHDAWPDDLPMPDRSLAWVTGRLFHPWASHPVATPRNAAQANIGYWLTLSQFKQGSFQGHWVNKSGWLAPTSAQAAIPLKHPLPGQFVGTSQPGGIWRHWFIVPDDWPAGARKRMLERFQIKPEDSDGSQTVHRDL